MKRWLFPLLLALIATPALAEPTTITVRALARDAKFIGTGMGGVEVTLVDHKTKRVLAKGKILGGTGDTERLVVQPRKRGERLSADADAGFTTVIDIAEPTLVTLQASFRPTSTSAPIEVSSQAWVLPGQPVVGDGWVVEFPGLAVQAMPIRDGRRMTLKAKVVMMCGCPVTPGGLWDADNFIVEATFKDPTGKSWSRSLAYAGDPSTFQAVFDDLPLDAGDLTLTAMDRRSGAVGVAQMLVIAR